MSKLIKQYKSDFTVLTNSIMKDKRLSYKELGLLVELLSLPDDWEFTVKGLSKLHQDGEDSVKAGLVKLEEFGYLFRKRNRDEKGKMGSSDYFIYDNPNDNPEHNKNNDSQGEIPFMTGDSPVGENPLVDNPTVVNPANKETMYKQTKNKSTSTTTLDINSAFNKKYDIDGMLVNDRQQNDINEMLRMIATREIKNTTKADLLNFLHKIYDEEKQNFMIRGSEPIRNLKGFVKTFFNEKTEREEEDLKNIKELADMGNEWAVEFVEQNRHLFKKFA